MNGLAKPSLATKPRNSLIWVVSVLYAGLLTIFVVAQLFTFEVFYELLISFLPFATVVVSFVVPFLVACEVFTLPFLLRMTVSPAFRVVSMVCGWLAASLWLVITLSAHYTSSEVQNVGFLGGVIELPPGWWAILISLLMMAVSAWVSWGLWPASQRTKGL